MEQLPDHATILVKLEAQQTLLEENNKLMRRMITWHYWNAGLRFVWFLVIIGAPFLLYFWVLEPYFAALGSSFSTFEAGLQEIPGWKQFYDAVGGEELQ